MIRSTFRFISKILLYYVIIISSIIIPTSNIPGLLQESEPVQESESEPEPGSEPESVQAPVQEPESVQESESEPVPSYKKIIDKMSKWDKVILMICTIILQLTLFKIVYDICADIIKKWNNTSNAKRVGKIILASFIILVAIILGFISSIIGYMISAACIITGSVKLYMIYK